jgi:CDP-diacylglycerol--glycerol-3-phosphate 3-phosphatidyltransferase
VSSIKKDLFNIPNSLTMLRIFLIPVCCVLLYDKTPKACILAAAFFGAAAITDALDGFLARLLNVVSLTGQFLDPLADKLIVMAMLVVLVDLHWLPYWLVVLVLTREITITGLRAIASNEGIVITAGVSGKFKTAFQLTGLTGLLIHFIYPVDFWFMSSDINFHLVGLWLFGLSVFFSLWSGAQYFIGFYRELGQREQTAADA